MHNFWAHAGSYITGAAGLWVFSAIVSGMPAPDQSSGKGYRWLYGTFHALAANLDKIAGGVNPPVIAPVEKLGANPDQGPLAAK